MTDQLRGLLERAVPDDAPTLDPRAVAAAARRSRNRSRAAVAGFAALAVVGGTAAFTALEQGDHGRDRVANDGSSAPYDAPGCPSTLPELAEAETSVASLDGLASVRLCPDLAPPGLAVAPPTATEQEEILAGMDALVDDLPGFADRVAAAKAFDPALCATISVFNTRQSLQLTYGDGRRVLVPTPMCSPITIAGREIDGDHLADAFLTALDAQRDRLSYRHGLEGDLTCDRWQVPSAARPGREHVVAAVRCDVSGSDDDATIVSRALSSASLRALDEAWQRPRPVPEDSTATDDESVCTAPPSRPSYLLMVTDRADVVRLTDTGCGFLLWDGPRPGENGAIPTTLDDLGLTP